MYSLLFDFLYLTLCFRDSSGVLGIAVVHSFDCYVIFHSMTIQHLFNHPAVHGRLGLLTIWSC